METRSYYHVLYYSFAWFRNWLHQNNAPCLISLFSKNTDFNVNSITGTRVFHQYSAWRTGIHWRTVVTSRVGHVLSIQFGDNHVVWSEANYYYSWHLATKVIFNCIIQTINSWIKITRKITFIGLAVQFNNPHYGKPYQDTTVTRICLRELPRKLKHFLLGLY